MVRTLFTGCAAFGLALVALSAAPAQDRLLQELYGRGVHAYFDRNYGEAHDQFTAAIEQGSTDPRCHFYRGLTYSKLGRPDEAQDDFAKGAELEASASEQFHNVSTSLQRVQGTDRLSIESHRRQARLNARKRADAIEKVRYQEFDRNQDAVIRKPRSGQMPPPVAQPAPGAPAADLFENGKAVAPPNAVKPGPATPPKPAPAPSKDPFGGAAEEKPTAPPKPAADDPFGGAADDKPVPPPKPAADDPFGGAGDKPAPPPKPAADDPFGDAKPAVPPKSDDPFGDKAPPKVPEKPKPEAPKSDDPFN